MIENKHITLLSLNFFPEDTAIGLYSTQMAEYLESKGAIVTVITAFPYYPQWQIWKDYKNKNTFIEEHKGTIRILRYKQYVPSKPTFLKRIVHIIDFTMGSLRNLRRVKECDIVISIIPFTSSGWLGNTLSRKRTAKHWIHIQDFEFDAAFQSGLATEKPSKGFIYKQLMNLERHILNRADRVSTISLTMLEKLQLKTNSSSYLLPNWIGVQESDPTQGNGHPYIDKNKFTILYSGNVGDKQDWKFFEKVVRLLDFSKYQVVVVGAGAKMEALKDTLNEVPINWYNPVPFSQLSSLLSAAEVHILFQKTEVKDTVMPSKILGMMASARPSIVTGNKQAEPARIFKESEGGYYESDPTPEVIIAYIEQLRANPKWAEAMGMRSRAYCIANFDKQTILDQFVEQLSRL